MTEKAGGRAGSKTIRAAIIPRLLTVAEVAEATGFKRQTVYLWIAQRRLPVVRIRRAVRIPAAALVELVAENTIPAREEGSR